MPYLLYSSTLRLDEHSVCSLRDADSTLIVWKDVVFVMLDNCTVLYCQVFVIVSTSFKSKIPY